ncbi:MAG: tellurite resistance TerB family protein [Siculibacillus sp.]|nr:tellurite resistance TerB family protein [Siculibacillus sp.]
MFDATKLLEQLLGPQAAATAQGYIDQGTKAVEGLVGPDALAKGKDLLGQGLSSLESTAADYVGADKVERAKTLVKENQLATGAAIGGLLGLLVGTESGRKVTGTAVKVGSLAALGGLAWKAWQNWQTTNAPTGEPAAAPPPTLDPAAEQKLAASTIIAMIQAAKADGHIDDAERAAIMGRVGELEGAARAFLDTELAAPIDVDRVASLATNQQEAIHLYAASLLAMAPDQPIERAYLAALAQRLHLSAELVTEIERGVRKA